MLLGTSFRRVPSVPTWLRAALAASLAACVEPPEPTAPPPASIGEPADGQIGTAQVRTPEGIRTVTYRMVDGRAIVDGDIVLPPEALHSSLFAAPAANVSHWSGGIVPYEIASDFPNPQRVTDAIAHYQRQTAVRFVPRTPSSVFYVRFVRMPAGDGCGLSPIGRPRLPIGQSSIGQEIQIADPTPDKPCGSGVVSHEIAHTLGMWHEQSRFDRDDFVVIHKDNILAGEGHNFEMQPVDYYAAYGPYDFGSIMHYGPTAFGKPDPANPRRRLTTISRVDGAPLVTQRSVLSDGDLRALSSYYPPTNSEASTMCRTARPRGGRRRADLAESWLDVGGTTSVAQHSSLGSAFMAPVGWARSDGGFAAQNRWMAGDFNGDGVQDLATAWNDAGSNAVAVRLSTGSAFVLQPTPWKTRDGTWLTSSVWLPGDFNNDGKTDIAVAWNDGGLTTVSVALSGGSYFGGWQEWAKRDGGWANNVKWNTGDFNNDGRDDLVAIWQNGTSATITVRTSSTQIRNLTRVDVFDPPAHWLANAGGWMESSVYLTGNFDGVGGTDVAVVWNNGGLSDFVVYKSKNVGPGFDSGLSWLPRDGGWAPNMRWQAGDFDADGFDDIAGEWNEGGMSTIAVRRSVPNFAIPGSRGFSSGVSWGTRRAGWSDGTSWCAGTFDAQ